MKTPPQQLSFDFGASMLEDPASAKMVAKEHVHYVTKVSAPSVDTKQRAVASVSDMGIFRARRDQDKTAMLYRNILASVSHLA